MSTRPTGPRTLAEAEALAKQPHDAKLFARLQAETTESRALRRHIGVLNEIQRRVEWLRDETAQTIRDLEAKGKDNVG